MYTRIGTVYTEFIYSIYINVWSGAVVCTTQQACEQVANQSWEMVKENNHKTSIINRDERWVRLPVTLFNSLAALLLTSLLAWLSHVEWWWEFRTDNRRCKQRHTQRSQGWKNWKESSKSVVCQKYYFFFRASNNNNKPGTRCIIPRTTKEKSENRRHGALMGTISLHFPRRFFFTAPFSYG